MQLPTGTFFRGGVQQDGDMSVGGKVAAHAGVQARPLEEVVILAVFLFPFQNAPYRAELLSVHENRSFLSALGAL